MHFNENANRPQLTRKDGTPAFKIKFPKYKKGKYSVSVLKAKPTFGKAILFYTTHFLLCSN